MAHSHSDTAFVTIEKSFTYRGNRELWQNAYHFDQVPTSQANWSALASVIWNYERAFLTSDVMFERALGHEPGTPPPLVFEEDEPPAGAGGPAGGYTPATNYHRAPGDVAMWIRYGTTQKSILGKPIYLRNYYHEVFVDSGGDTIDVGQVQAMGTLGAIMVQGVAGGTQTFHRAGPRGAVAQNHAQSTMATTRTLRARGRRHKKIPTGSTVQLPSITIE